VVPPAGPVTGGAAADGEAGATLDGLGAAAGAVA
jgi:hypothetical protein